MAHVITRFHRPNPSLIQSFTGLGVATVYEAAGRIGSVDPGIKPLAPGVRILGPAFTVICHPQDNLMLHKALQLAQPGDVLVASTGGHFHAGYWGGLMATSAMAKGIAGLAIDGCVTGQCRNRSNGLSRFQPGDLHSRYNQGRSREDQPPVVIRRSARSSRRPGPGRRRWYGGDSTGRNRDRCLKPANRRVEAEKVKSEKLRQGISSVELNKLDPVFAVPGSGTGVNVKVASSKVDGNSGSGAGRSWRLSRKRAHWWREAWYGPT